MRRLVFSAFLMALASCADSTGPAGLRLTLAVDKTQVARDDSVRVTLTATNLSRRPITVVAPESYGVCRHAFQIVDAQQRPVNVTEFLCALVSLIAPQPMTLLPGATVTARDYWKPAESRMDGQAIPAGTYLLTGRYDVEQSVVLSAPRSITVTP
jgi:hypothetical protein